MPFGSLPALVAYIRPTINPWRARSARPAPHVEAPAETWGEQALGEMAAGQLCGASHRAWCGGLQWWRGPGLAPSLSTQIEVERGQITLTAWMEADDLWRWQVHLSPRRSVGQSAAAELGAEPSLYRACCRAAAAAAAMGGAQ
jgi:hypothetical protein